MGLSLGGSKREDSGDRHDSIIASTPLPSNMNPVPTTSHIPDLDSLVSGEMMSGWIGLGVVSQKPRYAEEIG